MALRRQDQLAVRELAARGQRLVQLGGGVDALQPVVQQRLQAGVVQPQQVASAAASRACWRWRPGRR
jgi:hypothetical protein